MTYEEAITRARIILEPGWDESLLTIVTRTDYAHYVPWTYRFKIKINFVDSYSYIENVENSVVVMKDSYYTDQELDMLTGQLQTLAMYKTSIDIDAKTDWSNDVNVHGWMLEEFFKKCIGVAAVYAVLNAHS